MIQASDNYQSPALIEDLEARADHLVSAGRIFSAALRTARAMRMSPGRALRAAVACALRQTGVDWSTELDAQDMLALVAEAPLAVSSSAAEFHSLWMGGQLGLPYKPVLATDLYRSYLAWCQEADVAPAILPKFVNAITSLDGLVSRHKRWQSDGKVRGPNSFLYPLSAAMMGGSGDERAWLGDCVSEFRDALQVPGSSLQ